jgi:hypothetical protein
MPRQIQGSQRDFSFGEVDVDLKRNDQHPARKAGLRQMANARIHNSKTIANRSGRRALFLETGRVEPILMSPGNKFFLCFGQGTLRVYNSIGAQVFNQAGFDANGFIVPQFAGGEDLTLASLVAGQPWTMTIEPFAADAQSGADMLQRMKMRQMALFAVSVINSSGFTMAMLFSGKQSRTTPPLGTVMNQRRVPAYNTDEDATLPPILRETVETYPPTGSSYDPRVAIIKDSPGPLLIAEISMEISI